MLQVVGHLIFLNGKSIEASIDWQNNRWNIKIWNQCYWIRKSKSPPKLAPKNLKKTDSFYTFHLSSSLPQHCLGQVGGLANTVHSKKNNGVHLASKGHVSNQRRFCCLKRLSQRYAPRVLRGQRCSQLSQTKAPKQSVVHSNNETRHTRHRTTSIDFFGVKSVSMDSCTAIWKEQTHNKQQNSKHHTSTTISRISVLQSLFHRWSHRSEPAGGLTNKRLSDLGSNENTTPQSSKSNRVGDRVR